MYMANKKAEATRTEISNRWEAQLRKGALEMAILAALWVKRLYGLEIIRYLENSSQLVLAEGTIYPILSRLKTEGLLTSEWVEAEAGHPRKYYALTESGKVRVRQMAEAWIDQTLSWLFPHILEGEVSTAMAPLKAGLISGASLIIVAIATSICGLLERRRITHYGLKGLGSVSLFAKGSFWELSHHAIGRNSVFDPSPYT